MVTLFLKHALVLVTMDEGRREIADGAVLVRDNRIEAVGTTAALLPLAENADETLDLTGHVVLPGLVNTHHHMYQSLTRVIQGGQNHELFDWLTALYPIWARLKPDMIYTSALTAMAELILSGCTTSSDHLYIYPNGCRLDDSIRAAQEIGIRFHAARGSMTLSKKDGGLPPDAVVEKEADILSDTERLIQTYHDPAQYAMLRIVVAPCSPFSVTESLMRESAKLARSYGARLHTHLAENSSDVAFSLERFKCEPAKYAENMGWVGEDVWHAHCVKLSDWGIGLFARTGTGVCHCPASNMRLASGIAPVRKMRDAGVRVGLGVDGSASNDSGNLLDEARLVMLLQRVTENPGAMSARESLEIATRGGAAVLGREDIGALIPGRAADIVAFNLNQVGYAGAWHDPVAALLFCAPTRVSYSLINGRVIVREGQLTTLDLLPHLERHNALARQLVNG
jgi:cytosine/adenosine deaminase-related metal-dependent hydrolase